MGRTRQGDGRRIRVCLVSSIGGHVEELRQLKEVYGQYDHFWALNAPCDIYDDMQGKTVWMTHSERDWRLLCNLWEAWMILRQRRPTVLLSTGAGCIVPFALMGKLMRISTIYIESLTRVSTPSLTGRIMRYLATKTFYQWPQLAPYFPHGIYGRVF